MVALILAWLSMGSYEDFTLPSLAAARGPCAQLLPATEVATLGAPKPPFAILDMPGKGCALDNQHGRGGRIEFGVYLGRSVSAHEERKKGHATVLSGCGVDAWSVERPDAWLLVLVAEPSGAYVRFDKTAFPADVTKRACKLVAPRAAELLATFK